jgi:regulatory protein
MIITAITPSARKEGRFDVLVEGRSFALVSLDIVERLDLGVGVELSPAKERALLEEAEALATYDRALNLLAVQARSSRDLKRRLVQKGEPAAYVERAIERLTAVGLLDDAQFARQLARSKAVGQGASKRRVQQEMFKRGVARDVADEAITEVFEEEQVDESESAEAAARKKLRTLTGADDETRRRRLYGFLARRGYGPDAIRATLERVLHEEVGGEASL